MKSNNFTQKAEINLNTTSSVTIYSKSVSMIYDFFVLGLSNTCLLKVYL
jgi:hypothetical protein